MIINLLIYLFLIIVLGYLLGSIDFFGIKFGNSAIIVVGMLFGHFGAELPEMVGTLGLVFFLGAVGLKAGKNVVYFLKNNGLSFLLISIIVISLSGLIFAFFYLIFDIPFRSEEHTSELQSRFDLVCRLLLEKKKKSIRYSHYVHVS